MPRAHAHIDQRRSTAFAMQIDEAQLVSGLIDSFETHRQLRRARKGAPARACAGAP